MTNGRTLLGWFCREHCSSCLALVWRAAVAQEAQLLSMHTAEGLVSFLQLCDGATLAEQQAWQLGPAKQYHYLNQSSCYQLKDVDNAAEYKVRLLFATASLAHRCTGAASIHKAGDVLSDRQPHWLSILQAGAIVSGGRCASHPGGTT